MDTFNKLITAIFITILLGACSYTPEEQAKFDAQRAYWQQNNGYGGSNR